MTANPEKLDFILVDGLNVNVFDADLVRFATVLFLDTEGEVVDSLTSLIVLVSSLAVLALAVNPVMLIEEVECPHLELLGKVIVEVEKSCLDDPVEID